jgi:hypothetical protein
MPKLLETEIGSNRLGQCEVQLPWTPEDASQWWERRDTPEPALTVGN